MTDPSLLRQIPQVDQLLREPAFAELLARRSRVRLVAAIRDELDALRQRALTGHVDPLSLAPAEVAREVERRLDRQNEPYYRRVINATGVVLHTGLGRASLPRAAAAAVAEFAVRPQRLEVDLVSGDRGGRDEGCALLITRLLDCEAATVVNNNAAATLVALAALAENRRVVVSRGELVEIGGSYRIPEIIAQSGATMVEVGTTNRTHLADYRSAVEDGGESPGALLKVHTSNYQVVGFTSEVEIGELAEVGRECSIPVIHDLGSGSLVPFELEGIAAPLPEPSAVRSLRAGVDLVCFSGDKLLGGPQAGILAGRREAVERCRRHPLFRAMRPGRMTYTALEATLRLYLDGPEKAVERIPALHQLSEPAADVESRARRLAERLGPVTGVAVEVEPTVARAGSGALPLVELPSFGVRLAVAGLPAERLAAALRTGEPAVLGRIRDQALVVDLRTVDDDEIEALAVAVERTLPD